MSRATGIQITGATELIDLLENVGERHARNLMRSTVHGVAGRITKQAKKNASTIKDTGTLIKGIKTVRKKSPPMAPVSEVQVFDAFYWRFHEYGTQFGKAGSHATPETRFIGRAADEVKADFVKIYTEEFGKKLEAALKREARRVNR